MCIEGVDSTTAGLDSALTETLAGLEEARAEAIANGASSAAVEAINQEILRAEQEFAQERISFLESQQAALSQAIGGDHHRTAAARGKAP